MTSGFIIGLMLGSIIISAVSGATFYFLFKNYIRRWKEKELSKEVDRALNAQRSIVKGQISEELFPMVSRRFGDVADFRFVGDPIDYVVFQGLSEQSDANIKINIKFVEVKTGSARLNLSEKLVKDAVENKRVSWEEVRL
jgi:predicted Holliday junction resolvase-like endonuclease